MTLPKKGKRQLFFACLFSAFLHVVFLLEGSVAILPLGDMKKISPRIVATLDVGRIKTDSLQSSRFPPVQSISTAKELKGFEGVEAVTDPPSPSRLVFGEGELDQALSALNEPILEPPYGFGDDVAGRVSLRLLIGDSGVVLWVFVESTELDDSATRYVVEGFRRGRFSAPVRNGKPTMAIVGVEVSVGESHKKEH